MNMKTLTILQLALLSALAIATDCAFGGENEPIEKQVLVGPATEKRFPPLKVPEGFNATLFACDPLIEYPSVISLGPRPGTLLLTHDYMTGLGVEIVRRDEIRLIEDSDGDGYADRSTVYAKGFNSIQGLAFDDGAVYAMHAPLLTRLRDTDGDGVADERRDLIKGLGLPPEENSNRLHCANGVVAGHDGWLYLALGDRGCDVQRIEGDRLLFQQGGILRCRPDGRDLHVFATGLRNIYDVALDEELNVFVRDNENDGGDYMIRVCHCFHGSDHGYPYHYLNRPDEAMPPLADLGRGSSAGGSCYLETALPPEFHGNLFFCEWGRSVVRYPRARAASSFAPMKEIEFAVGDPADPYGFKPTDLVVDHDGSLLVSDWADGQRPKRGRGRIYRITYPAGKPKAASSDPKKNTLGDWISTLDSPSYHARRQAQRAIEGQGEAGAKALELALERGEVAPMGRLHAVWVFVHLRHAAALNGLFHLAQFDDDPRVSAQALRAIADLTDPVLAKHRLNADSGDARIAERLAVFDVDHDPRILLEVIIALRRLRWPGAARWLHRHIEKTPDAAILHATMQTVRGTANWPDTFAVLDDDASPIRPAAAWALAEQGVAEVVDGLLDRLKDEQPERRREYADLLSRVYKKPAPWTYWGFRPGPRPANSVTWDRTERIEKALAGLLADPDRDVRAFVVQRMVREEIPVPLAMLSKWLDEDDDVDRVAVILDVLKDRPAGSRTLLEGIVREASRPDANRLTALRLLVEGLKASETATLLEIAKTIEDGPVLAKVLHEFSRRPKLGADTLLLAKLKSAKAEVRAAALRALTARKSSDAAQHIVALLADPDVRVRRAAALAAGELRARDSAPRLLALASDSDPATRAACLISLRILNVGHAVDVAAAALEHEETQLAALAYLRHYSDARHHPALMRIANSSRSQDVLSAVVQALSHWAGKEEQAATRSVLLSAIARIQGDAGMPFRWTTLMMADADDAGSIIERATRREKFDTSPLDPDNSHVQLAEGLDGQVTHRAKESADGGAVWLATTEVFVDAETQVEFLGSSNGSLHLWVNSELAFQHNQVTAYRPDEHRIGATLPAGVSGLLVRVTGAKPPPSFQLRFRRKSSQAEHERLATLLLTGSGNANRGREVYLNMEKSLCRKCHRIGDEGGRIGPDLAGIGDRFSRIHLIESILQPSRTIAPSYSTVSLVLNSGRALSGVKVAEDKTSITVGDNQGKVHTLAKSDIDELQTQTISTMPDGLEKRLTDRELLDLLSFLVATKKSQSP